MDFIRNLTDKQAEDIIEADDVFMLRRLAHWIELLEGDLSEQRMSPARRDALWLHLRQHPDMRVLQALAANSALPDAIAIPVGERLRLGLTLNSSAFRSLRLDEIPALLTVSTSALINLARHVEDIPNQEVRHAVLEALLSFPDPAVRMELAGYTTEDAAILTRLLADTDPGVRAAARGKPGRTSQDRGGRGRGRRGKRRRLIPVPHDGHTLPGRKGSFPATAPHPKRGKTGYRRPYGKKMVREPPGGKDALALHPCC